MTNLPEQFTDEIDWSSFIEKLLSLLCRDFQENPCPKCAQTGFCLP